MMHSSSFDQHQVFQLNQQAIHLIAHSDHCETAISILCTAISKLRAAAALDGGLSTNPHPRTQQSQDSWEQAIVQIPRLRSNQYYIYNYALPAGHSAFFRSPNNKNHYKQNQQDHDWCTLDAAILLFNCALAHHQQGLRSATHLHQALRFYKMALAIAEHLQSSTKGSVQDDTTMTPNVRIVLRTAALNNMAVIHYELGNFDKLYCEDLLLDQVGDYLVEAATSYSSSCCSYYLPFHELYLNVLQLAQPPTGARAA